MKSFLKITVGVLLILAAIIGLIFSLGGLVGIWTIDAWIEESIANTLNVLDGSLRATYQGLVVTQDSLNSTISSVSGLQSTVDSIAVTVGTTDPLLNSVVTLIGTELPQTIQSSQESLVAAQNGAQVLDGLLSFLSNPLTSALLGTPPPSPDTSLASALGGLAEDLDTLPAKFTEMSENLGTTTESLVNVQVNLQQVATDVGGIATSLEGYGEVLEQYKAIIDTVRGQIQLISTNLPMLVRVLVWGGTLFLVWMTIAQLGLLTQGIEWVQRGRKKPNIYQEEIRVEEEPNEQEMSAETPPEATGGEQAAPA